LRVALAAIGVLVVVVLVGAPLGGWPPVVRLPAVLLPALGLVLLAVRPRWRELYRRAPEWQPSPREALAAAVVFGVALLWYVLTRFQSGQINAIDFTIYYDRPCFQTVNGRPLFVEVSDTPGFSFRGELADHAYWAMLPICSLYALYPTPMWLHALSAAAIAAGAWYVVRICRRLGLGGPLAAASGLAFVLNDNTARTLNYGFHPEVLYAWFVPWMIDAALADARLPFVLATVAAVLVKEDACLPLFAASVGLALHRYESLTRRDRLLYLALPTVLAVANLVFFYGFVLPRLIGESRPTYSHFWGNYGPTPIEAVLGMAAHPLRVLAGIARSGIFKALAPFLFLPLVGWRWFVGTLPIIVLYGASANDQVQAFGIYYAIVLVPFFVLGAAEGALAIARRLGASPARTQVAAAAALVLGSLLVGVGHRGYSFRPWKAEIAAVPEALGRLADEPLVLVQSGLFPHAGYDQRFRMLTPETLRDPKSAGAPVLLARRIDAYPFRAADLEGLLRYEPIFTTPEGLVAVRLPIVASRPGRPSESSPNNP
jgi:uncharacterized membrane protein